MVYYMELSQGQIIQKQNKQKLSSFFTTHHLNVMHAPVKFINIFHTVKELWHGLLYGTKSRAANSKTKQARAVFLFFTTLCLNVMHAPVKFHKYIPYGLGVMDRTRFTIWNQVKGR